MQLRSKRLFCRSNAFFAFAVICAVISIVLVTAGWVDGSFELDERFFFAIGFGVGSLMFFLEGLSARKTS